MFNIKLLNKISKCGTDHFDSAAYNIGNDINAPDAIMVRSASMHDMKFDKNLKAIARCGAGVNNIPFEALADDGIVVFNTPGANANGVKELAIAALLLSSRGIVNGVNWAGSLTENVAKSVEKGKSSFAGCELKGKTLGVIGLGAIGGMVANIAFQLGMNVIGYDPFITIEAAWRLSHHIKKAASFEEIYKNCDYITMHVPSTKDTRHQINKDTLAMMKDGVKIINLSRDDLVCNSDMKAAIESGKVSCYVTDFPTEETVGVPGIITIPHLGASTVESEDNCAVMAADQIVDFLENGNITNSVNYPAISMPRTGKSRLVVLHKNIPNMISTITGITSDAGLNINNMGNRSKGDYAVTLLDFDNEIADESIEKVNNTDGIIRTFKIL